MTTPSQSMVAIEQGFAELTGADRVRIRRELTGEAGQEAIEREAVYNAIRKLRLSKESLASPLYQLALRDVQMAVSNIAALNEEEG